MDADPILKRLDAMERRDGELAPAIAHLRDAVIVTAEVQSRQAQIQRDQAENLIALNHSVATQRQQIDALNETIAHFREVLGELADKLNGLIGYIDLWPRQRPSEQK